MRIALLLLTAACGLAATAPTTAPTSKPVLPPAPRGVTIRQNVAYLSPDREEKLDLYLPSPRDKSSRSPAVLIIHGGGWTGGDKAAAREFNIGTTLALHGYVAASVNYWMHVKDRPGSHRCHRRLRGRSSRADGRVHQ
jgi:acetyl esterase/lipase